MVVFPCRQYGGVTNYLQTAWEVTCHLQLLQVVSSYLLLLITLHTAARRALLGTYC